MDDIQRNRRDILRTIGTAGAIATGAASVSTTATAETADREVFGGSNSEPPDMRLYVAGYDETDDSSVDHVFSEVTEAMANLFDAVDEQFPIIVKKVYTDYHGPNCDLSSSPTRDEWRADRDFANSGQWIWVSPCVDAGGFNADSRNAWNEHADASMGAVMTDWGDPMAAGTTAAHELLHGFLTEDTALRSKLSGPEDAHEDHRLGNTFYDSAEGEYVSTVMASTYAFEGSDHDHNPHEYGACASGQAAGNANYSYQYSDCTVQALKSSHLAARVDGDCVAVGDEEPCDLDGDGLYRDVNGDGYVSNGDVTDFFGNQHTPAWNERPEMFDFNGNGNVGQGDVLNIFEYIQ